MTPYHILLVEDEAVIRDFVKKRLITEGYRVSEAESIKNAEGFLRASRPDLIVLDIMLPDGSGLELCRNLRGITLAPVLFMTSLGEKSQIVCGLRAGAGDYLVKPVDGDELVARIEALLRRAIGTGEEGYLLSAGRLTLEPNERRARWEGKDLVLRPKEYQLLSILLRNRNRFTSAEELYSQVWGMSVREDVRTVKVHISGLRRKLRQAAGEGVLELVSRKERGYRLEFTGMQEGG